MDDFKSNNRMFQEILNWLLGGMYNGNLNVLDIRFIDFKDPTRPEKTLSGLLLAIQACIIRSMIEAGRPSISAVDMHKYALELAEERPLAALLYICLLYYTVTLLHRKGPRDDDFDTHLSMVRFSISKYCCNHSTLYLRIAMDELQYCFTWSECEEKVYKSGIFTGETANGEPAPRDYIHEKTIRALSEQVGKTHKPGRDHYVEWAAFNVKDVAQNKKAMERMRAGRYDEENRQKMFTHDATAFAVATIALESSNITCCCDLREKYRQIWYQAATFGRDGKVSAF
jgi:hypothetical protein